MVSGKDNDNPRKLNFCLLFANYYLSYHKVNETNLDWVEFITKVNHVTGIVLLLRIFHPVIHSQKVLN